MISTEATRKNSRGVQFKEWVVEATMYMQVWMEPSVGDLGVFGYGKDFRDEKVGENDDSLYMDKKAYYSHPTTTTRFGLMLVSDTFCFQPYQTNMEEHMQKVHLNRNDSWHLPI